MAKYALRLVLAVLAALLFASAAAAAADSWTFVVMSDSQGSARDNHGGVATETLTAVVNDVVKNAKPELILFTGDLIEGAATADALEKQLTVFRDTMAPAYEAKIPVRAIRGSHDVGPNNYQPWSNAVWNKVFSGDRAMPQNGPEGQKGVTYSLTHKNAFFLGVDCYQTPNSMVLTMDLPWIKTQLAANRQPHVFAFSHTQIKRVEHSESLDNVPAIRDEFVKGLIASGGRTYFCGHMHVANITALNPAADPQAARPDDDFFQVICPPSCTKFYSWKNRSYVGKAIPGLTPRLLYHNESRRPGYTLVEIAGPKVTLTFKRLTGGQFATEHTFAYTISSRPSP